MSRPLLLDLFCGAASPYVKDLEADNERLTAALRRIQSWDCLNPPRPDLLADLPWLRRLVDEALDPPAAPPAAPPGVESP